MKKNLIDESKTHEMKKGDVKEDKNEKKKGKMKTSDGFMFKK